MYIRNKQQIMIFAIAALMIIAFAGGIYLPLSKESKAVSSQRDLQLLMINDAAQQNNKLDELKSQLETLRSQIRIQQSSIPEELQLGQFLQTLASLMNQYDLQEQFVKPGQERKAEQLWCVPIVIRCKGRLLQIYDFFKSLQSLERLIRIEAVTLSNSADMTGHLTMEMKAVIFYRDTKDKS